MFRRILTMLRPYRGSLALGFLCMMLGTPLHLVHPLFWMYVVDVVIAERRTEMLLPALGGMLALHLVGTLLLAVRTYLLSATAQRFVADLRNRLHEKLSRQSLSYHHDHRSGDLVSRVIGDVDTLQEVVINGVDAILANALGFVWVAGVVVWLNFTVGAAALAPLVLVAVIVWVFNARVKHLYRRIRDRLGDLSAHLQEHLMGVHVIKAFNREAEEHARFSKHNDAYKDEALRGVVVRTFYMPSVMSAGFFSNIAMLGVGAWMVLQGHLKVGALVAYRGYYWQLFSPVMSLAQINEMIQRANAAAGRIFQVLDEPESIRDPETPKELPQVEGRLRFEGVDFAYTPERPVMRALDLEVSPGQQIGVVGPSGAGKSTVLNLILRFYDPQVGRVTLDGIDLRDLRQSDFRRHMATVTQESFLFNDTVLRNIKFGRLNATDEEVFEAARSANAHEFVAGLPEGYGTVVGERGVKLSGGQKQRLCIARAFLANPRILLLDEATASVEPESEAQIQAALERLMQGRTTVIVSHRLSLVRNADAILAVQDGRVIERGTHDELMAHDGWYARMYNLQSAGGV